MYYSNHLNIYLMTSRRSSFQMWSLYFVFFNIFLVNVFGNTNMTTNCSTVAHLFEARGIKPIEIPKNTFFENVVRYCEIPSTGTCCTYNMESRLAVFSRQQVEDYLNTSLDNLSSILSTRAKKFNDVFSQLLLKSKKEFHTMFKRTYGVIYEQNAYMFSDLFQELEKYYARGKVDLSAAMDSFFNILYQKMFTVLNAQYSFNDKYLQCVSKDMKEVKPFGDVPDKLSVQIKRSFVATRTFAQAILSVSEITKKLINMRLSADCTAALTKMNQCGICKGYSEKPCANYCVNVMKGCLQNYNVLESEWDNFVNAIERISDRLLGPFNIVMVVEPINIKISEAIMNFQETGQDISKQVFRDCGKPVLGRKKRSVFDDTIENKTEEILDIDKVIHDEIILSDRTKRADDATPQIQYEPDQYTNIQNQQTYSSNGRINKNKKKQNNKNKKDEDYVNREANLDRLIRDIKQKVKDTKKFWSNLPFQICNNNEISTFPNNNNRCWNGNNIDGYKNPIVNEHGPNPEFPSSHANVKIPPIINNQLYYLKTTINHLRNAYNGLDVDWSSPDELEYESGSGSGSGIDNDDEDIDNGSGFTTSSSSDNTLITNHDHQSPGNKKIGNSGNEFTNITNTNYSVTQKENHKPKENSSSKNIKYISLRRALILFLFPIYMAWFAGICSDLL